MRTTKRKETVTFNEEATIRILMEIDEENAAATQIDAAATQIDAAATQIDAAATKSDSAAAVWVPLDGSPTEPGPIIRHGEYHCTIQMSNDIFIVTGGHQTEERVTEYNLSAGTEIQLNNIEKRSDHACGAFQDANGQQVRNLECS